MTEIASRLRRALGTDAVLTGEDLQGRSAGIWGPTRHLEADVLVRPGNTEEVSRALRICNQVAQPVVTHGGLTGVVDGARANPGDVVLSAGANGPS